MKTRIVDFDLEKAKAGAKIVTRGGYSARILCYDSKNDHYPIVALIDRNETEEVCIFTLNGTYVYGDQEDDFDLFIEEPEFEKGDFIAFGDNIENLMLGIFKGITRDGTRHNYYLDYPTISRPDYDNWTTDNIRPATDEEKRILLDALEKEGKSWNAEKKCIEELPKKQLTKEHVFQPFERVLVRDLSNECWKIDLFSNLTEDIDYLYQCSNQMWMQCIPYEGNEELLGTNKKPNL